MKKLRLSVIYYVLLIMCAIFLFTALCEAFYYTKLTYPPIIKAKAISTAELKLCKSSANTKSQAPSSNAPTNLSSVNINHGFAQIAEHALPSVVSIATIQNIDPKIKREYPDFPSGTPFDDLFRDFFDTPEFNMSRKVRSLGSGFVIRVVPDIMYIVTNNHVIADAKKITVYLHDKTELDAVVHAVDDRTDIAILKIKLSDLPATKRNIAALEWGNADETRVGDWIISIGNPFGLSNSITAGIVSSKGRDLVVFPERGTMNGYVDDFIQHSAQINLGNSGGCLLNIKGQVIGINTAIFSPTGGNVGVGFAVPSGVAKKTVDQLIEFGRTKRGWIGVRIQPLTKDMIEALGVKIQGVIVGAITNDSPAEKANIKEGDIIYEYNGKLLNEQNRFPRLVGETDVGKTVPLKVLRKGKEIALNITVGEYEEAAKSGKMNDLDVTKSASKSDTEILGLTLGSITENAENRWNLPSRKGALIIKIAPGSLSDDAGLAPGEVIIEVNQKEIQKPKDVLAIINQAKKNGRKNVMLLVIGKGGSRYPSLRIEE
ncbi:MAG: trypsin-like peptidase domain-containing protein [Candidatus Paracaedibacteraceae bacterium]|nr:trypsin-like peptidase domain-containing protein [Candidatus Paracaedibacteraceae bacterium]